MDNLYGGHGTLFQYLIVLAMKAEHTGYVFIALQMPSMDYGHCSWTGNVEMLTFVISEL